MTQPKEIPEQKNSPPPRYRYWTSPPESLTICVADIEAAIPRANWKPGKPTDKSFELPASMIFGKNVPRISLHQLAELLPDYVLPSDGVIRLPATRLAAAYHLVQHREELPPEVVVPEVVVPEIPLTPVVPESGDAPVSESKPLPSDLPADAPTSLGDTAPMPEVPTPKADSEPPPPSDPPVIPDVPPAPIPTGKVPSRRTSPFVGLPFFRKKTTQEMSPSANAPDGPPLISGIRLPQRRGIPAIPAQQPDRIPEAIPETVVEKPPVVTVPPPESVLPPVEEVVIPEPVPESVPEPDPLPKPVFTMLKTETLSREVHGSEITEQEPLQALFLTDENMTVERVIELCGGLPGINSCVLAHGSVVVASHNVPEGVDLVSMSAHAADMLRSMRESSARMGVGTVPAVTLHTEKGVISFFHRDDLTMLVFHKDRGFIPGVREKMAAVLGELTKARLTLPVGGEDKE